MTTTRTPSADKRPWLVDIANGCHPPLSAAESIGSICFGRLFSCTSSSQSRRETSVCPIPTRSSPQQRGYQCYHTYSLTDPLVSLVVFPLVLHLFLLLRSITITLVPEEPISGELEPTGTNTGPVRMCVGFGNSGPVRVQIHRACL